MKWIERFKTEGLEGLKDKPGRGAKPLIPLEHQVAFRPAVLQLQEKTRVGRARGKDILELMQTKYGINPTLKTLYNSLKRAGLVLLAANTEAILVYLEHISIKIPAGRGSVIVLDKSVWHTTN